MNKLTSLKARLVQNYAKWPSESLTDVAEKKCDDSIKQEKHGFASYHEKEMSYH